MMMNGFGQLQAASLVSALSLFILIGSLVLSRITDRINPRISLFFDLFIMWNRISGV